MEDDGFELGVEAPVVDAPWWVEAFAMADVDYSDPRAYDIPDYDIPDVDIPDHDRPAFDDLSCASDVSVEETLLAASLVGPGVEAARLLASLRGLSPSQDEWLAAVQLWERQDAWAAGQRGLAVLGYAGPEPVTVAGFREDEALTLELAMAVGCSDGFAYQQIVAARVLSSTLARTGDLLRAGQLSAYRARLIVDELAHLHPDVARQVEEQILRTAATTGVGRLRRSLSDKARRAEQRANSEARNERRVAELASTPGRRVEFVAEAEDGLMGMFAYLPPVEAMAMQHTLNKLAGPYRKADGRLQPERQADALMGAVLGFDPNNPDQPVKPKVKLCVLIDIATLLGLRDRDGDLLGYGHLPADVVRELATHASWQRLVYDPVNGYLMDAGVEVHDLPALTEFIQLRDRYDRFPGGTLTAEKADGDHTKPFRHKSQHPAVDPPDQAAPDRITADEPAPDDAVLADAAPLEDLVQPSMEDPLAVDPPASNPSDGDTHAATNTSGQQLSVGVAEGNGEDQATSDAADANEEGGHTSANNLAALSRRHHRAKTFLGFHYRHLGMGVLEWTTPLGRKHRTYPHDYRPDDDGSSESDSDPPAGRGP